MPFTPYHFGPAGLLGYIFRKWIDLPAFVFANVIVDIEVAVIGYFHMGRPCHRLCHTLLIGTAVGLAWGILAYLLLPMFRYFMNLIKIDYHSNFLKIIISAIMGVWFHVLIDGIYHYDVKPFWPMRKNPLWRLLSQSQIKWICIICAIIFVLLYAYSLKKQFSKK